MKSHKTELEKRLFEPCGENFKPLKKSEVEKFLKLSANGRENFYQ